MISAQERDANIAAARSNKGNVQADVAAVKQAELNQAYTKIKAPIDGYVTNKSVATGDYVQVGQRLMALVPPRVWVTANFKETQLTDMRPGQPAKIEVDAYPSRSLRGHVDSVQAGSGARFSLLPPENATGNFVKVVQRVPVKIVLDEQPKVEQVLGPGMSAVPDVKVMGAFWPALEVSDRRPARRPRGNRRDRLVDAKNSNSLGRNRGCAGLTQRHPCLAAESQPVADRRLGHARDLHGSARHLGCECFPPAHRRQSFRHDGRSDLGADELSGRERHHSPGHELVRKSLRPKTLSRLLHHPLYALVCPLRRGRQPWFPRHRARPPGRGRRRAPADFAGRSAREFPAAKRGSAMAVFAMGVVVAPILGPTLRRLDHRQLQLALGLLHQPPDSASAAAFLMRTLSWRIRRI